MSIRAYLFALVASTSSFGCDMWNAPKRVTELEARVDDLSAAVSAMSGKPVGGPTKHEDKDPPKGDKGDKHAGSDGHAKTASANGRDEDAPAMPAEPKPKDGDEHGKATEDKPKEEAKPDKPKPAHAPHFAYAGEDGPKEWGELDPGWASCGTGKAQSPIDITPKAGTASPITFHYKPTAAAVVDNGHTLQVNLAAGSSIVIDDHTYDLLQFHVHTPSEHVIAGEQYPLEVHLVHKDRDGKLAVIGVLYDVGPETKALQQVWSKWPAKTDVEQKLKKPFDPMALLPETRTVYRYSGSLTTPPCSEGVVWNVMRRTMTESRGDLTLVGLRMKPNARPVQPLNERKID